MAGSCARRVALVTGASRGVGKGIATRLAAEGADVALVSRTLDGDEGGSSLASTTTDLRELGGRVMPLAFDLADADAREEIVLRVEAALGPIDILVNNAASIRFRPFLEFDAPTLRMMQEVNVWAPWELARAVLPGMISRGEGWILNITSAAAEHPRGPAYAETVSVRKGSGYGASKAMLNRMTTSLAAEFHERGIAINALAPVSAAKTELVEASLAEGRIAADRVEPLETLVEAALALCVCNPLTMTGRLALSLELLCELGQPVRDLYGRALVAGWQPEELPALIGEHPRYIEMTRAPSDQQEGEYEQRYT